MDAKRKGYLLTALAVLVPLLALWLGLAALPGQAAAIPTPVANAYSQALTPKQNIRWFAANVLTTSAGGTAYALPAYNVLDVQYLVDVGSQQTVTLKLQYSNDAVNWVDGVTVLNAGTTDQNGMNEESNFGMYTRLYATLGTTNPVTITVIGLAK